MSYLDNLTVKAVPNQAWSNDASIWMQSGLDIVRPDRTASSSPVEAAISLIANDISTLEPRVIRENEDGSLTKVKNTPVARVLAKPNDFLTTTDFIVQVFRDVFLYGNFYAWADRDSRKQIRALYPIRPRRVTPKILPTGEIYYSIGLTEMEKGEESGTYDVPASDIFHHRVLTSHHPLIGVSPLYAIGSTAAMNAAITENMARFHQNNSRPGGILTIPGGLKQEARERLRHEFTKVFSSEGAGKTAILDFDAKFEKLGYSANEGAVSELLKYSIEDVCRALRIPRAFMMLEGNTNTGVEATMRLYYSHCLRPFIEGLENRFDDFFGFTATDTSVEFDINDLFRAETITRVESLTKAVQGGIMTPNEARRSENLPPVEGGNSAFLQKQMVSIDLLTQLHSSEINNSKPKELANNEPKMSSEEVAKSILDSLIQRPTENITEKLMESIRHG